MRQPNDEPRSRGWHSFSTRLAAGLIWPALIALLLGAGPAPASDKIEMVEQSDAAQLTVQGVTTRDAPGSDEATKEELTLDITVTSPEEGTAYVNEAINITAAASGKVASIVLYGDANELRTCIETTYCSTIWESRRLLRGGHTARATVTDMAGQQESEAVTIYVTSWKRGEVREQVPEQSHRVSEHASR